VLVVVVLVVVVLVVVVLDVLVTGKVVVCTGTAEVSRSYCTPDRQASGLPQHTPALRRYQPGTTWYSMFDCKPYQSSFCARRTPFEL